MSPAKVLTFQLYGPMASWGEAAMGEVRASASAPTRSALVGLVACALGIKRHQEQELALLSASLQVGVALARPGFLLLDYHTAQVPHGVKGRDRPTRRAELSQEPLHTVLSTREYRCDAYAMAALWARQDQAAGDSPSLEVIHEALLRPASTLYLGRKSCPLGQPLCPTLLQAQTLREALEQTLARHGSRLLWQQLPAPRQDAAAPWELRWEGELERGGVEAQLQVRRPDAVRSRRRWQFEDREEHVGSWRPVV